MGLLDAFVGEGHARWQVKRSIWERPEPVEVDLLRDPDGLGWQLDRPRFGAWLRSMAVARGAAVLAPAEVESLNGDAENGFRISLSTITGPVRVKAGVIIDAAGRRAPLATRLGARRERSDRLVCGWIEGRDLSESEAGGHSETYLEATPDGWWYTAPVAGRRLLAFYTDADLSTTCLARDPERLLDAARNDSVGLAALLAATEFEPTGPHGFTAAHSAILRPCAGPGWLAAGDAVLSVDPVSSQGLLTAMVTGLAVAECADRFLTSAEDSTSDYTRMVSTIHSRYRQNLLDCYAAVRKWPDSPFWARRQSRSTRQDFGPADPSVGRTSEAAVT